MKFNALLNFLHRSFVIVNNKLYTVRRTMKNATFAFSPRRKVLQPCFNSRLPRLLSRLIRAFRARIRIHIAARSLYLHLRRDLHFDYCFKRALVAALIERVSAATRRRSQRRHRARAYREGY
jgi:hypothetical protein